MSITVTVAAPDVVRDAVRSGEQDLCIAGVASGPYQDLIQIPLFDDGFVVVSSVTHRLARKRRVTIPDLAKERWAVAAASVLSWQWLHRMLKEHALDPPLLAMQSNSAWVRLLTIASTDVLGFSSPRFLKQVAAHVPLAILPVRESRWQRHIGISYRRDAYMPPAAMRLIETLRAIASKVSTGGS